ncbi:alcohol dehydrogenase catalytic domain-containing protein [Paraburkholderia sp. JHI869]|uniref:alcohol dehydrogenase catalytic domain-containing protein n=1 Tax=Paraburkholderia sp. JHI869 TaxID=3112959 RepID=UPI00316EE9FF
MLIAIEARGVCSADAVDVQRENPGRVPGHEVVGRIDAIGSSAPAICKIGQRVGVGASPGGHCNECVQCRQGRFQICLNQTVEGATCDGGHAEMMIARATGLVAVPDELASKEAAPILCAGISTFDALKKRSREAEAETSLQFLVLVAWSIWSFNTLSAWVSKLWRWVGAPKLRTMLWRLARTST